MIPRKMSGFIFILSALLMPYSCACYDEQLPEFYRNDGWLSEAEGRTYKQCLFYLDNTPKNREKSLFLFNELLQKYPDSLYAPVYREIIPLLQRMVEEDKNWKEPKNIMNLTIEERINYYIYKLRDITEEERKKSPRELGYVYQYPQNSAPLKLIEIGELVIPCLKKLLNDRRPIMSISPRMILRGIEWWDESSQQWLILKGYKGLPKDFYRYQDAAREIIEVIKATKE